MFISSGNGYFELTDGEEAVIFDIFKIDVFDRRASGSVFPVFMDGSKIDKQIGEVLVLFDER